MADPPPLVTQALTRQFGLNADEYTRVLAITGRNPPPTSFVQPAPVWLGQSKEGAMHLWRVDVFENRDDSTPSRCGYVAVDSEQDAVEAAKKAMGEASRADLTRIRAEKVAGLPPGSMVWADQQPSFGRLLMSAPLDQDDLSGSLGGLRDAGF